MTAMKREAGQGRGRSVLARGRCVCGRVVWGWARGRAEKDNTLDAVRLKRVKQPGSRLVT